MGNLLEEDLLIDRFIELLREVLDAIVAVFVLGEALLAPQTLLSLAVGAMLLLLADLDSDPAHIRALDQSHRA